MLTSGRIPSEKGENFFVREMDHVSNLEQGMGQRKGWQRREDANDTKQNCKQKR
jgi:transcriptional regulator of heat shock response